MTKLNTVLIKSIIKKTIRNNKQNTIVKRFCAWENNFMRECVYESDFTKCGGQDIEVELAETLHQFFVDIKSDENIDELLDLYALIIYITDTNDDTLITDRIDIKMINDKANSIRERLLR